MVEEESYPIEGTDPRNPFQRYVGSFLELNQFKELEKTLSSGGYEHKLPEIASTESAIGTGKRRWVDGENEPEVYDFDEGIVRAMRETRPNDLPALYPWVKVGIDRRAREHKQSKEGQLENIVRTTPNDFLEAMFASGDVKPVPGLSGEYANIAKLHAEYSAIDSLFNTLKSGKNSKGEQISDFEKDEILKKLRKIVKAQYESDTKYVNINGNRAEVKPNKKVVFSAIKDTIAYSDRFVLNKAEELRDIKKQEYESAIQGKVPEYVKATLSKTLEIAEDKEKAEKYVFGIYEKMLSPKSK